MLIPGAKCHEAFYSICQACFYIICFLGKHILESSFENSDEDHGIAREQLLKLLRELPWIRVVFSELDPLMYCLKSVRREFMSVAKVTRLLGERRKEMDIHLAQMEITDQLGAGESHRLSNKRDGMETHISIKNSSRISNFRNNESTAKASSAPNFVIGANPLDSFFPFDPYLLRLSSVHVDEIYVEWNGRPTARGNHNPTGSVYEGVEDEDIGGEGLGSHAMHISGQFTVPQSINAPKPRQRTNSFYAEEFDSADLFNPYWCEDVDTHQSFEGPTPMSLGRSMSPDTNDFLRHKVSPDANDFARPRVVSGAGSW